MKPYPWRIDYHDGSGNGYGFSQSMKSMNQDDIWFEYTPIKQENSSSGIYSGGEAVQTRIDAAMLVPLWAWIETLFAEPHLHVANRMMGTGALRVQTGEEIESCIISDSAMLREFHAFVQQFRRE